MIYSNLIRPLAFRLDPETAHHLAIAAGARLGWAAPAIRAATCIDDGRLAIDVAGLRFPSPIGLAAGFDKSGSAISALAGLGFSLICQGPNVVRRITMGLTQLLSRDGVKHVADVVGVDA
ncbi:hypothetical protein [Bradyrhizobium sp. dw_411]|uniref:hypothetical protein n=1 Tax=Bradyrhizobium sp. dw_411 TaxID=2720082 RepID=UPI001BD11F13|nr:hypothetical protein [Bradyrhizobium sp. dw_411]